MSWSEVTNTWDTAWADDTRSNTTTRNTSRFVLLTDVEYDAQRYVNFQPRIQDVSAWGAGFYLTDDDPILLHDSGESTI